MNEKSGLSAYLRVVILAATSSIFAGCAVDHKDQVARYRKVYDPPTAAPMYVEPGQVLTLTQALRMANRNNERLGTQGESYLQAMITKDRAFANFLPTISISPSYSIEDHHGSPHGARTTNLQAPAGGQINLFNGFRDLHSIRLADYSIEEQKQFLLDAQQTLLLDVVQAYYQILRSEQSVEVLTNSLAVQEARVHDIRSRAALGNAKELDVAQQEAQASQTRVTLNQDAVDVVNGRSMLAFLLDAPVQENPLLDDFTPPADIPTAAQFIAEAEAKRQDLRAANSQLQATRENVEIAFGEYYPTLNLNLSYILYKDVAPADNVWSAVLSANIPIFEGGRIEADVQSAWSQFRQSAMAQSLLRRSIDNETSQAYADLNLARRQLRELQVQVEAAKQALFLADSNYLFRRGTLLDRLIAQDTLLSAQLQLTTAQFAQKTAYLNLLRTVGRMSLTIVEQTASPSQQTLPGPATQPTSRKTDQEIHNLATQPVTQPAALPEK